jgi:hypothetical protein
MQNAVRCRSYAPYCMSDAVAECYLFVRSESGEMTEALKMQIGRYTLVSTREVWQGGSYRYGCELFGP